MNPIKKLYETIESKVCFRRKKRIDEHLQKTMEETDQAINRLLEQGRNGE